MRLIDEVKFVTGCPPAALTGAAGDGDYISMKNYTNLSIVIQVDNGSTVTGGAISLKQATAVAGTGEQPLGFSKMFANIDAGASDDLVETVVSGDTFTTDTTNNKNLMYVIDVQDTDLDIVDGYDCVRIDVASMANAIGSVTYILSGAKEKPANTVSAITD